jgi:hypothetical protein
MSENLYYYDYEQALKLTVLSTCWVLVPWCVVWCIGYWDGNILMFVNMFLINKYECWIHITLFIIRYLMLLCRVCLRFLNAQHNFILGCNIHINIHLTQDFSYLLREKKSHMMQHLHKHSSLLKIFTFTFE